MLTVRLFGPVGLTVDDADVALGSIKQRGLLALLALEAGRVVSLDRLIDELWPDSPPPTSTSTLQVYVSRLRRMFGDARAGVSVTRRRPGYVLDVDPDLVDVHRVARLLEAARAGVRDNVVASALTASQEAAALISSGPPLADLAVHLGSATAAEVQRLVEVQWAAREALAEALLLAGRPSETVDIASAMVAATPLRENAHALLIRGLYGTGRIADALTAYGTVRRLLDAELGTEPGPVLQRLHAQVLRHDLHLDVQRTTQVLSPADGDQPDRPVSAGPVDPSPASSLGRADAPRLIGRGGILRELAATIDAAGDNTGAVRVLDGEAGIGKTSVAVAAAERAAAIGVTVAWGRCDPAAAEVPLWPWLQALAGLPMLPRDGAVAVVLGSPDLDQTPSPAAQLRLIHGLAAELTAVQTPTLLVLEDVHWADEMSLALMVAVAERCERSRLVLICSYRTEAGAARHVDMFSRLARTSTARRIPLSGLSDTDVGALIGQFVKAPAAGGSTEAYRDHPTDSTDQRVAAALRERTNGNPFFVTELLRTLTHTTALDPARLRDAVPGTVADVVAARVDALPLTARRLLQVAAVAAPVSDLQVIATVSGLDPADLDAALGRCVDGGLLTEQLDPRPATVFRHSLIRETIAARLGPHARTRLHADIATAMLRAHPDSSSDELVHHLLAGQSVMDPMAVVPPVLAAATRAMNAFAMTTAESMLSRALQTLDAIPAGEQRDELAMSIHTSLGLSIATRLGWSSPQADASLGRAAELAAQAAPSVAVVAALMYRGAMLTTAGRFDELREVLNLAERHARTASAYAAVLDLLVQVGRGSMDYQLGQLDSAVTALSNAVAASVDASSVMPLVVINNLGLPARSFLGMTLACLPGRGAEALRTAGEAVGLSVDDTALDRSAAYLWRSITAATLNDFEIAASDATAALQFATTAGTGMYMTFSRLVLGWAAACDPRSGPTADPRRQDGAAAAQQAHDEYRHSGAHGMDAVMWCLLAEAHAGAGHTQHSRSAAHQGQAAAAALKSTLWHARLTALTS